MIIGMQQGARDRVRDQRIEKVVELAPPETLLEELPLGEERERRPWSRAREEVVDVLDGERRPAAGRGRAVQRPRPEAALDYAQPPRRAGATSCGDDLLVVMRVYFEKPRTTTGWKGLINDPHLDGSGDVNAGLRIARELLLEVLDLGLPVGCEFLDPITPQYISDAVAWGAIGARTTESQIHRQLGSGLSMPIGFKNRTDGNVQVAVDAVRAAAAPHAFAGIDDAGTPAILHTTGNPDCHVILRGGHGMPELRRARASRTRWSRCGVAGLPERLVIDASHDNSGKDPETPDRRRRRDRRPGRRRQRGDRRRDARVLPGRGPPGPGDRASELDLRPVDHRRLHRLGGHGRRRSTRLAAAVEARRG